MWSMTSSYSIISFNYYSVMRSLDFMLSIKAKKGWQGREHFTVHLISDWQVAVSQFSDQTSKWEDAKFLLLAVWLSDTKEPANDFV